jgi:hypothetical protein
LDTWWESAVSEYNLYATFDRDTRVYVVVVVVGGGGGSDCVKLTV